MTTTCKCPPGSPPSDYDCPIHGIDQYRVSPTMLGPPSEVDWLRDNVTTMVAWNDRHKIPLDLRLFKITEENGEVAQAYLGFLGANPRKGFENDVEKVWAELSDVAFTALIALKSLGGDPADELRRRMEFVIDRVKDI